MSNYRYPLDLLGTSAANRVTQLRTLNMSTKNGEKFFIPTNAPFFRGEGALTHTVKLVGASTNLVEGVDYKLVLEYTDIFQVTQKPVFGGILFKNRSIAGQIQFTAQVLGGEFLQPIQNILETVVRNKSNINTATWGEIAGVPAGYPVLDHTHESTDIVGIGEVVNVLREYVALALEILSGNGGGGSGGQNAIALIEAHKANPVNAHQKSAVGLGNVPNFGAANFDEADQGVNNKLTTPSIVRYMINKFSGIESINNINRMLTEINRDILNLQNSNVTMSTDIANLKRDVKSIQDGFRDIRQEFANVLLYIQDLSVTIQDIQNAVNGALQQVQTISVRMSKIETSFDAMVINVEKNKTDIAALRADFDELKGINDGLEEVMTETVKRMNKLEEANLYPIRRFIPQGTFHFRIKPGEKRLLSLYAAGGGGGILKPFREEHQSDNRGEHGGDTVLWLNTDVSNGMNNVGKIVLKAEGGKAGWSSTQTNTGIDVYGKGGRGGNTEFDGTIVAVKNNGIGKGGEDGKASASGSHAGGVGNNVQGKVFGNGGSAINTVGSGGAGGFISAEIENTFTFDLVFTLIVGAVGKNAEGNALTQAGPGLGYIDLVSA